MKYDIEKALNALLAQQVLYTLYTKLYASLLPGGKASDLVTVTVSKREAAMLLSMLAGELEGDKRDGATD
jgi:hypothetical protein